VLWFVAALVALDLLVRANVRVWRDYDTDDYREKVDCCRREMPDLVVVGGSPVAAGIDPAVLAGVAWQGKPLQTAYNLGLPGATTSEVWLSVEHGVRTPPRLLVYGVTATDLNDDRDEPHGPRSLMDAADVAAAVRARPRSAEWCVRQFAGACAEQLWSLYAWRNGIRLWAADWAERLCPGACPAAAAEARLGLSYGATIWANHGYAPRLDIFKGNFAADLRAGCVYPPLTFLSNFHLGGHLSCLHRLLDWADSNGVAVVLVDMPVTSDLDVRLHPQEFAAYRSALATIERTRRVRVERASREEVGLSDEDFRDQIHLNASGAARLSAWLRIRLAQDGEGPRS
jgi:hypothetical protein